MENQKKILFITTNNLSTNPRLLKELFLAKKNGFDISVIMFKLGNWSDRKDNSIIEHELRNIKIVKLSAKRKPLLLWLLSSIVSKLFQIIYPLFKRNIALNAIASNKRSLLINWYIRRNKIDTDLIIAHNLGALYPAIKLAEKINKPFAFDIEDYHPGEYIKKDKKNENRRRVFLMQTLLQKATYLTYASPLIGKHSLDLIENNLPQHLLINNCFSATEFIPTQKNEPSNNIKFVWFSQNVSYNRGLELIIPALQKFESKINLTIIGQINPLFFNEFIEPYSSFITLLEPMQQIELHKVLSDYDIGLAIELNNSDFNRSICLTNKIFAYAQSGLYILATNTPAQQKFIEDNTESGCLCEQTRISLEQKIEEICNNIYEIRRKRIYRFEIFKNLSWETESQKLLKYWQEILQ